MREAHGNYGSSTTLLRSIIEAHVFCGLMTEHKLSNVLFGIRGAFHKIFNALSWYNGFSIILLNNYSKLTIYF